MSYIHLTIKEREMLMCLKANGLSIRAISAAPVLFLEN